MLLIAILSLFTSLVTICGGAYVVIKARNLVRQNIGIIEDYFIPEVEGQATPFSQLIYTIGQNISQQVGESVGTQLRGAVGGTMKGATAELEQQAAMENPALAIMEGMPKSIKKNPLAFLAMQALINKNLPIGAPGAAQIGAGNHRGEQIKFSL